MRLRKVGLLGFISALIIGIFLSGCSSGNENNADASVDSTNGSITLNLWGGIPPENGPQEMVDKWNEDHSDVKVKYTRYVNDSDGKLKLDTALATTDSVDIYFSYDLPALKKRVKAGNALDLGTLDGYDIEKKIGKEVVDIYKVDDKVYGMPTTNTRRFLMLNKDLLDENDLPIPYDWTWEELQDYSEKMATSERYGFLQNESNLKLGLTSTLEELGYTKDDGTSNFDNKLAKSYLETLKNMMDNKLLIPYGEKLARGSQYNEIAMFLRGETAMVSGETHFFRYSNDFEEYPRDFEIALAPIPGIDKPTTESKYPGANGDMVSINPESEYVDEAWEFLQWYADGGMSPFIGWGRLPASNEIKSDETKELLIKGAEDSYDHDSLDKVIFNSDFDHFETQLDTEQIDIRNAEVEKYFLGDKSLEDALKDMAKRDTEFLQEQK